MAVGREAVPLVVVEHHEDVGLGFAGRETALVVGAAVDPRLALLELRFARFLVPFHQGGLGVDGEFGYLGSVELDIAGGFSDQTEQLLTWVGVVDRDAQA